MTPAERDAERTSTLTLRRMARLKAALEAEIARQDGAAAPRSAQLRKGAA